MAMLRRTRKAPEPGPVDKAARRRRRTWAIVAASVAVLLLLLLALFLAVWLRRYPAVSPRWARVPDAIAVVRLDWSGEGAPLVRAPLQWIQRNKLSDVMSFDTLWSSFNFLFHPYATVWIVPREDESGGGAVLAGNRNSRRLGWVGALNFKRRPFFVERQINRMFSHLGASLLGKGASGSSGHQYGSALTGGAREGALVLATADQVAPKVLGELAYASTRKARLAPSSYDDYWDQVPGGSPLAFVVRDPARWAAPVIRKAVGKDWQELFDAIWVSSSDLFGKDPWLIGKGTLPDPETLELLFTWDRANGEEAARNQTSAINLLILNINKAFRNTTGYSVEAAPAKDLPPDSIGITLRISNWDRLFAPAGSKSP